MVRERPKPIGDRLGQVSGLHAFGFVEIGDRARDAERAVQASDRQAEPRHGGFGEPAAGAVERRRGLELGGGQTRIAGRLLRCASGGVRV